MPLWLAATLVAMLIFTVSGLFQKALVMRRPEHPVAIAAMTKLTGTCFIALSLPLEPAGLPADPAPWLLLAVNILVWTCANILDIRSFRLTEVSDIYLIRTLSPALSFCSGILLFGEPFALTKLAGLVLILGGLVVLSYRKGSLVFDQGQRLQLLTTILLPIGVGLDMYLLRHFSLLFYITVNLGMLPLPMILLAGSERQRIGRDFLAMFRRPVLMTGPAFLGFCLAANALLLMLAMKHGELSRIMPLMTGSTLLIVAGGWLFLGERDRLARKLTTTVMGVAGVLLLTLS